MDARPPIEPFQPPASISPADLAVWIDTIESFPRRLVETLGGMPAARLDAPYRPGGWTRRQVVHHVGDSHLNSFVRFKWALTEPHPTIKAYDENAWARLDDYSAPIASSIALIGGVHRRWVELLSCLTPEQLQRTFHHPESGESVDLATNIAIYAWHGDHHLAQIQLP